MVGLSSVTEPPSLLGDVPASLVKLFLTLVIECNIVYLILEFSHIKVCGDQLEILITMLNLHTYTVRTYV